MRVGKWRRRVGAERSEGPGYVRPALRNTRFEHLSVGVAAPEQQTDGGTSNRIIKIERNAGTTTTTTTTTNNTNNSNNSNNNIF